MLHMHSWTADEENECKNSKFCSKIWKGVSVYGGHTGDESNEKIEKSLQNDTILQRQIVADLDQN